ncbi:MAG: SDR family oxidoreductase [Bacteroidia bacterium]
MDTPEKPYVLVIAATSDIGKALAHEYARHGYNLHLTARNQSLLQVTAEDIRIRYGVEVTSHRFDVLEFETHEAFYRQLSPAPKGVICVAGYLGNQQLAERDFAETRRILDTNYTGCVSILNIAASHLEQAGNGFITGISSVAGERGRQSNYFYGSSKAAFSAYLSGLRNRLYKSGVHVLTVKPGFVDTKMTEGMETPALLTSQPDEVAHQVFRAAKKRQNVLYVKWFWRGIMSVIKNIPEQYFKKLKL